LNLCELCENNYNHYTESFNDIFPLDEEINNFKNIILEIIKNIIEEREAIDNEQENEEEIFNNDQENECIKIKSLFIESFSKSLTNYNYINNVNNIIRCTFIKDSIMKNLRNDIIYIRRYESNNDDINSIENKILIKSLSKHNTKDFNSQTLCMKKLNDILINSKQKIELIAIGGSNNKILILDSLKFNIYQIIEEHKSIVYSLAQYKNNFNFLFSSSEDRTINIYKLDNNFKYVLIQKLKKSRDNAAGEISKIIALENKLLISGDNKSITIWKSDSDDKNNIYKDIFEIVINRDICNLLEVNPSIFIAIQYSHGGYFQVYKNDGKNFPLIGELSNIRVIGISSNSLEKLNDNLVCSTAINFFYIISIEPLQIIQKVKINSDKFTQIFYIYATKDNYLYCKGEYQSIIQYKIIKDEDNNFIELKEIGKFRYGNNICFEKAILPFDDGRIFYVEEKLGEARYNLIA
jgi:WD40 repeat protein